MQLLPPDLQQDFEFFLERLATDPLSPRPLKSHALSGELKHHRALELDCEGIAYRLVYRVYDQNRPRRTQVLSVAEHDPAYEQAKKRQ
ncbi:hypothetical protein [Synechococcus elongatus]|uniref:type II toxin-antitoxin system RelE family toxin n=1 Tax=Synechococcus elongatus TaxID=32046 RepID=UPI0030D37351